MLPTFQVEIVSKLFAFAGDDQIGLQAAYCALVVRNCIIAELEVFTVADDQTDYLDSLLC